MGMGLALFPVVQRFALLSAAICAAVACGMPLSPSVPPVPVAGQWQGAFDSSWGSFPVTASFTNEQYLIIGNYAVDARQTTGTISGTLEVKDPKNQFGIFYGELTIAYKTDSGEMCQGRGHLDGGSGIKSLSFSAEGFTSASCPDAPAKIRITLHR
jgi:hypothetical protein